MVAYSISFFTQYGEFYPSNTLILDYTRKRKIYTKTNHDWKAEMKPVPYKRLPKRLQGIVYMYERDHERLPGKYFEMVRMVDQLKDIETDHHTIDKYFNDLIKKGEALEFHDLHDLHYEIMNNE